MPYGSNDLFTIPPEDARKEALNHPNGYVYVLEKEYRGKGDVPPEGIIGCWKVDEDGLMIGPFIPNPNYKAKTN